MQGRCKREILCNRLAGIFQSQESENKTEYDLSVKAQSRRPDGKMNCKEFGSHQEAPRNRRHVLKHRSKLYGTA